MRAGQLRHLITVEQKTTTPDGIGGGSEQWSTFAETWAAIWPVSASETVKNMQASGEITHRVRIRFIDSVTKDMRITYGSREFEIVQPPINFEERNQYLDILCKEDV